MITARASQEFLPGKINGKVGKHPTESEMASIRIDDALMAKDTTCVDAIDTWYHHWVLEGFEALEQLIEAGPYCCGDAVTIADICLVPQLNNARRLKVPLDKFPKILSVDAACLKLPAFDRARPENQPDAE